ncbi:MAG: hypothetical protein V7K50_06745 [Nostoc sp.]
MHTNHQQPVPPRAFVLGICFCHRGLRHSQGTGKQLKSLCRDV